MGDISTHAAIADIVMGVLMKWGGAPANGKPPLFKKSDMMYFELGNWLTDMSQFRDPPAFIGGKLAVWQKADWKKVFTNLSLYLDVLMGTPTVPGVLVQWLERVVFADGCERFRRGGISPDEFEDVFKTYWTQYYPHEHVDFPPWPHGSALGDRTASGSAAHECGLTPAVPSDTMSTQSEGHEARRMLSYQEQQVVYLAELLSWIEENIAKATVNPKASDAPKKLHMGLARLGHASHALEDFYFHSNFVELAWSGLGRSLPEGENAVREKRIYERRLRQPVGEYNTLSKKKSEAADTVFTGSFGGSDVFHTLGDALEGLAVSMREKMVAARFGEDFLKKQGGVGPLEPLTEALAVMDDTLGWLVDEDRRLQLRKDEVMKAVVQRHHARLKDGTYLRLIDEAKTVGVLHKVSAAKLKEAMKLDKDLAEDKRWKTWGDIPEEYLGTYPFLLSLLVAADKEHEASEMKSREIDSFPFNWDLPTDNGASAENIGCHSLMSKDSVRKLPLREEAFNIATCAATYVARVMVERVRIGRTVMQARQEYGDKGEGPNSFIATLDSPKAMDWLHLLQHFICHPDECEKYWHVAAMDNGHANGGYPFKHVPRPVERSVFEERLKEKKKAALEKKYNDLAIDAQAAWKKG